MVKSVRWLLSNMAVEDNVIFAPGRSYKLFFDITPRIGYALDGLSTVAAMGSPVRYPTSPISQPALFAGMN